jgi:phosphatidylglycerophosphatase A
VWEPCSRFTFFRKNAIALILTQPQGGPDKASQGGPFGRLLAFLATGFGAGFVPKAPGTVGSLLGLPLVWCIQQLPHWGQYAAPAICFAIGVPICGIAARRMGLKDPGAIVFDEISAFSIVFLLVPINLVTAAIGFILFRLFDIWKPWPANRLEKLPGGLGIMADDFAAAVYAGGLLWLIARGLALG